MCCAGAGGGGCGNADASGGAGGDEAAGASCALDGVRCQQHDAREHFAARNLERSAENPM